jgi:hypothetical protein
MRMNIFGFQMAVKKFLKRNTINFLNYAFILRRNVYCVGCSFKFPVKVGVEESIVNALRITDHGSAV